MPFVRFQKAGKRIEVPMDTTLFEAALSAGLPVASSCQADFVCGKCHMEIVEGPENLSPQTDQELKLLRKEKAPESNRISCQAKVRGDCAVATTYW